MQTRKDVYGQVSGLVGDPYFDWLTPEYFAPLCQTAYEAAIMYLELSCSPNIEKLVLVPNVPVGVDETNLIPWGNDNPPNPALAPLAQLVEPRYVDFKTAGAPNNQYHPCQECTILPDTPPQVTPGNFDIRVRGTFRPAPLTKDTSVVEIHPLAAHALAFSIGALIGMERPNDAWTTNYGTIAKAAWDVISAKLTQQMQRQQFRLGSPNRGNGSGRGWNYNLQANMGFEWRSFGLYVKLI
jgi:hypothetical protein